MSEDQVAASNADSDRGIDLKSTLQLASIYRRIYFKPCVCTIATF